MDLLKSEIKIISKSWKLFYFINIRAFWNKLRNLSYSQSIALAIGLFVGGYYLYHFIFVRINKDVTSISHIPTDLNPDMLWILGVIVVMNFWNVNVLHINQRDSCLIAISNTNMNPFILYETIRSISRIFFLVFISIVFAIVQRNIWTFFFSFLASICLRALLIVLKSYFKTIITEKGLLNNAKTSIFIRLLIIMLSGLLTLCYVKKCSVFIFMTVPFRPFLSVLSVLFYRQSIILKTDPGIILFWIIACLYIFLFTARRLVQINIHLKFGHAVENNRDPSSSRKYGFHRAICNYSNRMSAIFRNELRILFEVIITKKCVVLIGPSAFYIFMLIYSVYMESLQDVSNGVYIISLMPILFIAGFIPMVVIPLVHETKDYLWIYRIDNASFKRYIMLKFNIVYLLCEFSVMITTIIASLILKVVFNLNLIDFMDWKAFGLIILLGPILPTGLGLYGGLRLPDVYYYSDGSSLQIIFSVLFVWLSCMLAVPVILVSIFGYSVNWLFYPAAVILSLIQYILIPKFLYRKLKTIEI